MSISLNAEQKTLKEVFTRHEKYVIPLYQRPYSWGYDECLQLYSDLIDSFEADEGYFLGNIILARSLDTKTKDELEVIDGQQRLTTLILFFKAIKLIYPKTYKSLDRSIWIEDEESDEKIPRIVTKIFEIIEEKKNLELVINIEKNDFLKKYYLCLKDNKLDLKLLNKNFKNNRFLYNLILFNDWIKYYFEDIEKLRDFIKYLFDNVYMLPIELVEENKDKARDKALVIFERINNRGLNLSDADIFKANLYSKADDKEKFAKYWSDIKNQAGELGYKIDDIFRFYSHIIRGINGIITSEINLRDFFTLKSYSPFKQKLYNNILDDLFKILEILKSIKEKTENNKWLQILNLYTNQFPKFALVCYVYKNGFSNIDEFLIKLIRYVYKIGSTTYVKFEIYKIIDKIFKGIEIDSYIDKNYSKDDFYMGKLKKGFFLLGFYLNNNVIENAQVERLFAYKELESKDLDIYYDTIANFTIKNEKKELRKKLCKNFLEERKNHYENTVIFFMKGEI